MNEKYTIEEFLKVLDKEPEKDLSFIIRRDYAPLVEKTVVAQDAVKRYNQKDDMILINSPMTYLCYVISVLRLYTNLEIRTKDTDIDYDALQSCGLIDKIFAAIGKDLVEYETIFKMCERDFRENYVSASGFFQAKFKKIEDILVRELYKFSEWLKSTEKQSALGLTKESNKTGKKE